MLWFRCGRARREKPVMGSLGGQLTKQKRSAAGKARSICNVVFQSLSCVRLGRLPCPSLSPGVCSNLCSLSRWCHPTISSSVVPFSFCPQSFLGSGSFPMSWFLTSGGQNSGVSASASVLSMNTQCWFPLGLTGLISLQSKRFSRVFSSAAGQKHQCCNAQKEFQI